MNTFVTAIREETDLTLTENGGVTYSTSMDALVDMFFHLPAKRGASYEAIKPIIKAAFDQDPEIALRIALWIRDAREGAGERQTFKHILTYLVQWDAVYWARAVIASAEVGRIDDPLFLVGKINDAVDDWAIEHHVKQLGGENAALAAKWTPRKGPVFGMCRKRLNMTAKEFRKFLVGSTNVVETKMCEKRWDNINYSHVPSVAMTRYTKAFNRNDGDRFGSFMNRVRNKEANPETGKVEKINTGAIFPHDVLRIGDEYQQDTMWKELPDLVPEGLSFLPIIDTSGSMGMPIGNSNLTCMNIATTLGVYLAERNKSAFKDLWINFHSHPKFKHLKGDTLRQKLGNLDYHDWGGSTNLEAAMNLIAVHASNNNVLPEDMPKYLLVLSDMEFNGWGNKPVGKMTRELFESFGYEMPNIVWWNINSRGNTTPVRANEDGMALVSGFSPTIMTNLLEGEITPIKIMLNTVMKDRYKW